MKQDFEYNEEKFEINNSDEKIDKPLSIEEMIEQEKEEKEKFYFKDILKNKYIYLILIFIIIIFSVVIFIRLYQNKNNIESKDNKQENKEEIIFDENGFIEDEEIIKIESEFKYNTDDIKRLREAGYTSTEIEEFEQMEVTNLDILIDDIKEQTKKNLLENYRIFLRNAQSTGNEEYLYALANTWLGLEPQIIKDDGNVEDYYKDSCNADYWKLPLQGYQPMLKIKFVDQFDIERTAYMSVDPSTYVSLRDSGNINITYDFIKAYGCEFIINIQKES